MSTPEQRPPYNTPNLGLPVPGDAGPADAHADIGALADALDALYARLLSQPGDIKASAAQNPTAGWLLCDGAALDRVVYADLFAAIGTSFGAGDGATTFNVPNLKDAFPKGALTPAAMGGRGGEASHVLDANEMPVHAHSVYDPSHAHGLADPGHQHYGAEGGHQHGINNLAGGNAAVLLYGNAMVSGHPGAWTAPGSGYSVSNATAVGFWVDVRGTGMGVYGAGTGIGIYNAGASWAHNNLPPFQNVNYFIKT